MTDAERIFHEVMIGEKTRGRLGDLEGSPVAEALLSYRSRGRGQVRKVEEQWPSLGLMHFDIVDDTGINAWAFKRKDIRFIGVSAGVYLLLQALFGRMMADRRILPQIGDVNAETEDPLPIVPFGPEARDVHAAGHTAVRPRCTTRAQYAQHLSITATDFLVFHEMGHHLHGHLDYKKSVLGVSGMSEGGIASRSTR